MQTLFQDIAYGWRMLRKSPGLTAVILTMLTLGIGANTTVFTIFDAILLRPLTFERPQELVQLWETNTQGTFQQEPFSYPDYLDLKQQSKSLSSMGGYSNDSVTLSAKTEPSKFRWQLLPRTSLKPLVCGLCSGELFARRKTVRQKIFQFCFLTGRGKDVLPAIVTRSASCW